MSNISESRRCLFLTRDMSEASGTLGDARVEQLDAVSDECLVGLDKYISKDAGVIRSRKGGTTNNLKRRKFQGTRIREIDFSLFLFTHQFVWLLNLECHQYLTAIS